MPAPDRDDPYRGFPFRIEIRGVSADGTAARGFFTEVSGLETGVDPLDYREGAAPALARKVPGLRKFTSVTLKRGIIVGAAFRNWIRESQRGARASGSIVLLDETRRNAVMRWTFVGARPSKFTSPSLNATGNDVAMDSLEISIEGLSIGGQTP